MIYDKQVTIEMMIESHVSSHKFTHLHIPNNSTTFALQG